MFQQELASLVGSAMVKGCDSGGLVAHNHTGSCSSALGGSHVWRPPRVRFRGIPS